MTIHNLRIKKQYLDAIVDRRKTFEIRLNDRQFQTGDVIVFDEINQSADMLDAYRYVGRKDPGPAARRPQVEVVITYVYTGDPSVDGHGGLQSGYVVLGFNGYTTREVTA